MNKHRIFIRMLDSSKPVRVVSRSIKTEPSEATANTSSIDYCADIVKQHDYENFLATLLMTKSLRSPAFVLRAFNVEVARVQDLTSDAQTAAFRLQFWHDALKGMFNKEQTLKDVPANPVAQELFKVCCCYGLQRRHLEKLITSRSNMNKAKYFKSLEDIEKYAEESVSSVYYLLLGIGGVKDVHADHAASHLGKAQGITNILRSVHVSSRQKVVFLPMDILMKYELSQENVLRCTDSEQMRNAVFEIASRANSHLEKARKIIVPETARQIFLPATAVDNYLTKLQKRNFNIFDRSLLQASPILPFKLYYNRLLNKF
ncbi:NADH dehydrogenase (ubiquinone) complex I, assembly factor 6 homolog isoform X1 [Spodoptera frugiperda]|uniref:15-cis-phytoene synthase n=2 Tax=Spodoptera frugiperda TaxID=7108 RepID=A0A9R0DAC6_SPOFR|nr:NADH dehydrogenase (ubiquinone) complex I, assembly factor 6 homolog isoform X1 [Spodoptera frugiperda]